MKAAILATVVLLVALAAAGLWWWSVRLETHESPAGYRVGLPPGWTSSTHEGGVLSATGFLEGGGGGTARAVVRPYADKGWPGDVVDALPVPPASTRETELGGRRGLMMFFSTGGKHYVSSALEGDDRFLLFEIGADVDYFETSRALFERAAGSIRWSAP